MSDKQIDQDLTQTWTIPPAATAPEGAPALPASPAVPAAAPRRRSRRRRYGQAPPAHSPLPPSLPDRRDGLRRLEPRHHLPLLRQGDQPRAHPAAGAHRRRRREPQGHLRGRQRTGTRRPRREGVAGRPRPVAAARHHPLGRQPLGGAVRRGRRPREDLRPRRRQAADEARRLRAQVERLRRPLRLHRPLRRQSRGAARHRLALPVLPALHQPAGAGGGARADREPAADGHSRLHPGHRRSRPGRARRAPAQRARHRHGRGDRLHPAAPPWCSDTCSRSPRCASTPRRSTSSPGGS